MPDSSYNALLGGTSSYADPQGNALLARASNDPNAMFSTASNALQVANQGAMLQRQQIAISQDQFNLAKSKFDGLGQIYSSLAANPTMDNFTTLLGRGVQMGFVDPATAAQATTKVSSFNGDPAQIRQFAVDGANINQSHADMMEQAYGRTQGLNVGGSIVPVTVKQGAGAGVYGAGGGPIATTLSPGDKVAAGKTVTNSDRSTTFLPGSDLYDDKGNFIGNGNAPSVPVYRGSAGGAGPSAPQGAAAGQGAPSSISFGSNPPAAAPPPSPAQGAAPPGRVSVGYPASSGPGSGTQANVPAPPAGQGAGQPQMVTPSPQSLPVITRDQAAGAMANWKAGNASAVDRNLLRGFAVQNNQPIDKMGPFEPQPAGVGAAAPNVSGGAGGLAAPGAAPAGQPVPAGAPSPQAGAPASGAAAGGAGAPLGQSRGLTMSLSPGQEASLTAGSNSYAALASDVSNQEGSPKRIFQLSRALDAIRNTTTGRGTAARQEMLGYLDALPGGIGKAFPGVVDPNSLTNYDLATKYTNAIAMSAPGAARSDAGLATAASANASTNGMTQQAAMDVITNNLGQERAKPALLTAFQNSGQDPGNFNRFAVQWLQGVDPRAFALGDMTPAERSTLYNGLQGRQRTDFLATVKKGLAAGVLQPGDLQGATANGQ